MLEKVPENASNTGLEDDPWDIPAIDIDRSALIIDGTPYYAGIGYSPTQDRLFAPAIDNFDMFQSNDIPEPLNVEVAVIKNNQSLESFVRKTTTRRTGGLLAKIFGFGRSSRKVIESTINFDENSISVVARVSVQSGRYLVDGNPFLNSRAQALVDQGQIGDFVRRYGPGYVESQVIGGDVYYVYNYDLNRVSIEKRTNFERNIEVLVKDWFGLETNKVLTNEEKQEITNASERYMVESNIVGFTPNLIDDVSQIQSEVQRIQAYLNQNPTNAAAMEMTVASYANILQYEGFSTEYDKAIKCYQDWEGWMELQAKLDFIYKNTTEASTRNLAESALANINQQLVNSRDCNGSTTPNLNQYNNIQQAYTAERKRIEIDLARINMSLRYESFTAPVNFSVLAYEFEGTIPLYRLRQKSGDRKVMYVTTYDPKSHIKEGIAGYVYPNQVEGTIRFSLDFLFSQGYLKYTLGNSTPSNSARYHIGFVYPPK